MKLRKITVSSFLFGNFVLWLNNYNWKPFQNWGKIYWKANREVENNYRYKLKYVKECCMIYKQMAQIYSEKIEDGCTCNIVSTQN